MNLLHQNKKTAIVIPYYNASEKIVEVVKKIPDFINYLIVVDDCGNQPLPKDKILSNINKQTQIIFLKNNYNYSKVRWLCLQRFSFLVYFK